MMNSAAPYEIAVVGGGAAGVAAAVQSARMGFKAVLLKKTALVGGLSTGGHQRLSAAL